MNSDQGTDPGKIVNARVRCTCGAEINYIEKVCRNGHHQAWMWEQLHPQTPDDPRSTGPAELLFPAQVAQQHYALGDRGSPAPHPGLARDCGDPECIHAWQLLRSVEGVGPDAPTGTDEHGASQSNTLYAFTSLDPHALFRIAATAAGGDAKYGVDNWRGISERDHINHALIHIYAHLADDTSDDHLAHAACRMLMALAIEIQGGPRV